MNMNTRRRIYRIALPASLAWCLIAAALIADQPTWWTYPLQAITIAVCGVFIAVLMATVEGAE